MNAICGDGMCPYVPCNDFPKCNHLEEWERQELKNPQKRRS